MATKQKKATAVETPEVEEVKLEDIPVGTGDNPEHPMPAPIEGTEAAQESPAEEVSPEAPAAEEETEVEEAVEEAEETVPVQEAKPLPPISEVKDVAVNPASQSADQVYKSKVQLMKENLDRQTKVRFLIPLGPGEKLGKATQPVTLNGYHVEIPKGEYVDIPEQVAELLADSLNQTLKAGENFRTDRSEMKDGISIKEALS